MRKNMHLWWWWCCTRSIHCVLMLWQRRRRRISLVDGGDGGIYFRLAVDRFRCLSHSFGTATNQLHFTRNNKNQSYYRRMFVKMCMSVCVRLCVTITTTARNPIGLFMLQLKITTTNVIKCIFTVAVCAKWEGGAVKWKSIGCRADKF